ncbi:hypothetical protein K431DRAFT_15496 [Polychaeton citri CBS 116435]|uniref:Uncharacterized protein n=1 Tax=Polychaeton citri CBS 116435 TaxID=1314669 RepID=A0A9P4USC0_9PEZI|nr:hypothetical protein K431DRAFT_15496 [Polychaeton citri CBS 116435]
MEIAFLDLLAQPDIDRILGLFSFESEDPEQRCNPLHTGSNTNSIAANDSNHQLTPELLASRNNCSGAIGNDYSDSQEDDNLQALPLPTSSTSFKLVPHAYERALANRVELDELEGDGGLSVNRYSAVFVHDIMMLPGSLANITSKQHSDPYNLVKRMTPALVPGFRTYTHPRTKQPCMIQSPSPVAFVHGIAVLGLKDYEIKRIDRHYRDEHRMFRVNIELEVLQKDVATCEHSNPLEWTLERCSLWAHAWIWSGPQTADSGCPINSTPNWCLEDYLEGKYDENHGS